MDLLILKLFHLIGKQIKKHAITRNLVHETYEQFSRRAKKRDLNFPLDVINRTIESIPKQIDQAITMKGQLTKY